MDKYEFNYKVDQLKKMVKQGEFETAMRIADSINWRRVHNTSLLSMVSEVYEKNGEYAEAKAILELAFERSSKGQRVLYKLTILSLKAENLADAEEYYKEFYKEFPEDARNYVLRYLILKEKGAHVDQMILTLEKYVELELDEEWMFELAQLYHEAGRSEDCIKTCDNIMLMFGLGKYVDKAIELKTKKEGVPLTDSQIGLMQNRDKYDERFKEIPSEADMSQKELLQRNIEMESDYTPSIREENPEHYPNETRFDYQSQIDQGNSEEEEEFYERRFIPREEYVDGEYGSYDENPAQNDFTEYADPVNLPDEDELNVVMNGISQEYDEATDEEPEVVEEVVLETTADTKETETDSDEIDLNRIDAGVDYAIHESEMDSSGINEAQTIAQIDNIVEEEQIGRDIKAMGENVQEVEDSEHDKTKILSNIRAALEARETSTVIYADATASAESEKIHIVEGDLMIEDLDYEEPEEEPEVFYKSAFVAVESLDEALSAAAEKLKEIYQVTKEVKQIAKIKAEKLNAKGVFASAQRIGEKDLIIEGASDLTEQTVSELLELARTADKSLVFVDTVSGIEYLQENYPELGEICGSKSVKIEFEEDDFEDVSDIVIQKRKEAKPQEAEPDFAEAEEETARSEEEVFAKEESRAEEAESSDEFAKNEAFARERKIFRGENVAVSKEEEATPAEDEKEEPDASMLEEMEIEAFVEYADHYATKIDCIIPGNSINALFERAEIMEEDGIILNKLNAEALIEEVADRAERPGLLRRIVSIFSKRYDKNGLLILKEEHFIS